MGFMNCTSHQTFFWNAQIKKDEVGTMEDKILLGNPEETVRLPLNGFQIY
jgi:hypothetical protein